MSTFDRHVLLKRWRVLYPTPHYGVVPGGSCVRLSRPTSPPCVSPLVPLLFLIEPLVQRVLHGVGGTAWSVEGDRDRSPPQHAGRCEPRGVCAGFGMEVVEACGGAVLAYSVYSHARGVGKSGVS